MTSIQLATALPSLERRLASLKQAKRILNAIKNGQDTSDNTEHNALLSSKWLQAGRDASEILWGLTKDNYQAMDGNPGFGGTSWGFDEGRTSRKSSSNWGWATPVPDDSSKRFREAVEEEIKRMSPEDREAVFKETDEDDEKNPLPDSPVGSEQHHDDGTSRVRSHDPSAKRIGSSNITTSSNRTSNASRPSKRARTEDFGQGDDYYSHESHEEQHDEQPEEERSDFEEDVASQEDQPEKRGMARMLMQCGIR